MAALLAESREHIYHSAMLDPHKGTVLDIDRIWALVDDLLDAHGEFTPDWARAEAEGVVTDSADAGLVARFVIAGFRPVITSCGMLAKPFAFAAFSPA